jgi:hypothetical protein
MDLQKDRKNLMVVFKISDSETTIFYMPNDITIEQDGSLRCDKAIKLTINIDKYGTIANPSYVIGTFFIMDEG